jgi:hypothetical protein
MREQTPSVTTNVTIIVRIIKSGVAATFQSKANSAIKNIKDRSNIYSVTVTIFSRRNISPWFNGPEGVLIKDAGGEGCCGILSIACGVGPTKVEVALSLDGVCVVG